MRLKLNNNNKIFLKRIYLSIKKIVNLFASDSENKFNQRDNNRFVIIYR